MKKTMFLFCFALLFGNAFSQPFVVEYEGPNQLVVTDDAPPTLWPGFDDVKVEFTAQAQGCVSWRSGKLTPAETHHLSIPPTMSDGLALKRTVWLRYVDADGNHVWRGQIGGCVALLFPDTPTATPAPQPFQMTVVGTVYSVDWVVPELDGNDVELKPTAIQPSGVTIEAAAVVNLAGYVVSPNGLPPGQYFYYAHLKMQNLDFIDTSPFTVTN